MTDRHYVLYSPYTDSPVIGVIRDGSLTETKERIARALQERYDEDVREIKLQLPADEEPVEFEAEMSSKDSGGKFIWSTYALRWVTIY